MNKFKAGAGTGTIHFPAEMFPLEGFCGIHDEPHARILLLESGKRAAIVSLELVMLPDMQIGKIQRLVGEHCLVRPEDVFVHLTHAITTPHDPRMMPPHMRPDNAERVGRLHEAAVLSAVKAAAVQAAGSITEASAALAKGESAVNANRDVETPFGWWIGAGEGGAANRELRVLRFSDSRGRPVALLLGCALKTCAVDNSQMEENKRLISSDVAGRCCSLLEEKYGVPVLFLMSAAANQVPRQTAWYDEVTPGGEVRTVDHGVEYGLRLVAELGGELAQDAVRALGGLEDIPVQAEIKTAADFFPWPALGRINRQPRRGLDLPLTGQDTEVPLWVMVLDSLAFVFGKAEMNPPTEAQLLALSPYPNTFLLTMTNGGMKYMPEAAAYDACTWEAQSACVARGGAEKFVEAAVELLRGIANGVL